jgi:hypothetical protein
VRPVARLYPIAALVPTVLVLSATAAADTYVVNPDGSGDYADIASAVRHASSGDVIELADGTFVGDGNRDIEIAAEAFTIRSQSGDPSACRIDCGGTPSEGHRGFHFVSGHGSGQVTLEGVGITGGFEMWESGAGIWVEDADPVIRNCSVSLCSLGGSYGRGGGIYLSDGADPDVIGCTIRNNYAGNGAGVAVYGADGYFEGCTIKDNVAVSLGFGGGVWVTGEGSSPQFHECEIVGNSAPKAGGVVLFWNASLSHCNVSRNEATSGNAGGIWIAGGSVDHCTLVGNSASVAGAGAYFSTSDASVSHSIIAFSEDGEGLAAAPGTAPSISCCDVYGNADGEYDASLGNHTAVDHNISEDPELCNPGTGNYTLYDTSPCLATSECGEQIGAFEEGCNTPVRETSWGVVKALWR